MNSLSGFNTQEIRRLHPYLSALLRRLKALEVKVEAGTEIVWGKDEDILPTGNANLAGILNKFARADHQHLFKFPTAVPLSTPDGSAFFDLSASAINIYVDDTPTTKVVAGATEEDVQPTGRKDTGTAPRYAFADHSHPTALLSQDDPQPPVISEIRYDADDKLVRWDGTDWVPLSVETTDREAGTDADVQPTKTRSAGSSLRFARADHSHPTAILSEDDPQTPEIDEIRYNTDNKLVRWDGSSWVPLSVETGGAEAGTNSDVQPTRLRDAGSSTRYARADHSHPTALLPQTDPQPPVVGEIRYNAENKLVRWDGSEWVEVSVERVEAGVDADVRPTKLLSAGSSSRFARADHSHPTAILPQGDTQTPEADEIRYTADDKLVRWDATEGQWVSLSVETFTVEWGTDVEPTRRRSTGSSERFARADHSHPTAILPQGDAQTPVADEIRYNASNKLVRWDGSAWVEMSVETVEAGTDDDVQPTRLRSAGSSVRFARADHSHPTALLPQSDTQTPVVNEIRFNTEGKVVRWNGTEWVPLSVETFEVEWATDDDVQPTRLQSTGTATRFARADHSHPTAILPQDDTQTPVVDEIRYNAEGKVVRWDGTDWVPLSVETGGAEAGLDSDVQPTKLKSTGTSTRFARADHSHPTAILPQSNSQTPVADEIRYNADNKLVRWNGTDWVPLSVETFTIDWGTNGDVQATGLRSAGTVSRVARADHSHPTALLPESDPQTPVVDEIRYNTNNKIVRWDGSDWVPLSVETLTIDWGTNSDVRPTGTAGAGTAPRVARADHSHPTALLPQNDTQTPVANEIRYNDENKLVRWNGSAWVPLSVETFTIDWGTNNDVEATGLRSAGTSTRVARADHSHPTAILHQNDIPSPVIDEIAYNADNKLVRWDGEEWVELSVEALEAGTISDVQPTRFRSAGTSARYARADHSHPTALLPQSDTQTPVYDEIRYKGTNRLVRWNGTAWVDIVGALPVPADPLVLPFSDDVSSPLNRQLVNHSSWDNIGNATVFYRDANNSQYRLIFARPLVVSTTSTPSGKDVWSNTANELVLKRGSGMSAGSVLWNRVGNTTNWSPVAPQLSDDTALALPTDVGVLSRSSLTGTSGSRRWFLRGAQEDGSFRAPFAGIATFTSASTPAPTSFSTTLGDGYAYLIHDIDRVDIVKPTTNGNKYPVMLPHYIISPQCRIFSTATDPSGHYVVDELWNGHWVIAFYTTTSANSDLRARLPSFAVPLGINGGRVLLYLHNPQSFNITTVFSVNARVPSATGIDDNTTTFTTINIPANTTVVEDLGFVSFSPSSTLSHHRAHLLTIFIVRRRTQETANANKVICLGVVIVPQREA